MSTLAWDEILPRPLTPSVAVIGLSSPLEVGAERAPQAAEGVVRLLQQAGYRVHALGSLGFAGQATVLGRRAAEHHVDAIVCVCTSWFEDYLALDLLEECPVPVLLWALPGMETGALCGTQQLTSLLHQLGWAYGCVFGEVQDESCLQRAQVYLRAAALKSRLRRAKVGLAGQHVAGMTHTAASEFALKRALGPRVMPLDLPSLLARTGEFTAEQTGPLWAKVVAQAGSCRVEEAVGRDAMAVTLALAEVIQRDGLSCLSVGCYPHLMGRVCLAASLLADRGLPLACEGDVNGAVGQLLLQLLTDQPTQHTDWLDPLADASVIFTHCGSGSFSLAERRADITLADVRLMGQGVCALFPAQPGPVTLLSLVARGDGYQVALLEGEALSTEMVFPGNPLRVRFAQPTEDLLGWVHEEGIGHHWAAGYGHVGAEIRAWAKIAGPAVRLICPS